MKGEVAEGGTGVKIVSVLHCSVIPLTPGLEAGFQVDTGFTPPQRLREAKKEGFRLEPSWGVLEEGKEGFWGVLTGEWARCL